MSDIIDTLHNIEAGIYGSQMMAEQVEELFRRAKNDGHHDLAVHAKKALDGLNGMVSYFRDVHSAIWESIEPMPIQIVDESRPKLTLIKGGKNRGGE
jgi:hypothetical protein